MAETSNTPVAERAAKKPARRLSTGLQVEPIFCPADVAGPFDTVEWDTRTAAIKGDGSSPVMAPVPEKVPS